MTTPPTAEHPAERAPASAAPQPPPAKGRRSRRNAARARPQPDPTRLLGLLTPREAQVLARLAAGDDTAELAAALGIAPATARTHLHRTMRKIGARTPQEAAATAAALLGGAAPPRPTALKGVAPPGAGHPKDASGAGAGAAPPPAAQAGPPVAPAPDGPQVADVPVADLPSRDAPSMDVPVKDVPVKEAPVRGTAEAAAAEPAKAGGQRAGARKTGGRKAPDRKAPDADAHPPGAVEPVLAEQPLTEQPLTEQPLTEQPLPEQSPAGPPPTGQPSDEGSPVRPPADRADPAFEELYESAHTRLAQQVFLLTGARRHTLHCVHLAFGAALRAWPEVSELPDPEAWVRARACEAALSPWHRAGRRRAATRRRSWHRPPVRPADEGQTVLPEHDRLSDQDRALLRALRRLTRPQRRALVLHDGIGLPAAEVAVEVESSTAAAEGRVLAARAALAASVPELVGADPTGPGFGDRLSALLHRAGVRGCPEPHRPPVPVLSARHRLSTAAATGGAALVTLAMTTAVATTLFGAGPGELFKPTPPVPHPVCTNGQNGSAGPAAPGGPPPGLRTAWCSSAPGREAVLGPPPPPALALWGPVHQGVRGSMDAAGPPGPSGAAVASCSALAPRPCAVRAQPAAPLPAPPGPLRAPAGR